MGDKNLLTTFAENNFIHTTCFLLAFVGISELIDNPACVMLCSKVD